MMEHIHAAIIINICFKVYLVDLAGYILAFVMYCIYKVPGSSVLIESTDLLILDGDTK